MKIYYTASTTATGEGRENGHVRSSDGLIDVDIAAPVELGGKGGATNPEQLFAAGYSACFLNALRRVARRASADVDGTEVTAEVGIGPAGEGAFGLAVTLKVTMPAVDQARAEELVAAAHRVCPYSNATRGNIDVLLEVV
jgi:osmotically inducible protein OsmC